MRTCGRRGPRECSICAHAHALRRCADAQVHCARAQMRSAPAVRSYTRTYTTQSALLHSAEIYISFQPPSKTTPGLFPTRVHFVVRIAIKKCSMIQYAQDPCQRPQRPTSKTPRWVLRALGVCGVCCGHTLARGCRRGPRFQVHVARYCAVRTCARRTPSCQSMDDACSAVVRTRSGYAHMRTQTGVVWGALGRCVFRIQPECVCGGQAAAARVLYGMRICARAAPVRTCAAPATQVPPTRTHTVQIADCRTVAHRR